MQDAVRMIATLDGFLARKGDGEPGVKTIWRGLWRLHGIAANLSHIDQLILLGVTLLNLSNKQYSFANCTQ